MGGKRVLRGGLHRMLPDHNTALGKALRREYDDLLASLGIAGDRHGDGLLYREITRVAWLRIRAVEAARTWAELSEKRRVGRGRRPSPRMLERAARRAALDDTTMTTALDRLRALVEASRKAPSIADLVRAGRDTP
jgi:hypothetical protein